MYKQEIKQNDATNKLSTTIKNKFEMMKIERGINFSK